MVQSLWQLHEDFGGYTPIVFNRPYGFLMRFCLDNCKTLKRGRQALPVVSLGVLWGSPGPHATVMFIYMTINESLLGHLYRKITLQTPQVQIPENGTKFDNRSIAQCPTIRPWQPPQGQTSTWHLRSYRSVLQPGRTSASRCRCDDTPCTDARTCWSHWNSDAR